MTTPEAARIRAVLDELHVGVFPPAPYLNGTEIAERIAAVLTPLAPEVPPRHRHRYGLMPVWTEDRSAVESWWWCTDHPTGEWAKIEDDPEAAEAIPVRLEYRDVLARVIAVVDAASMTWRDPVPADAIDAIHDAKELLAATRTPEPPDSGVMAPGDYDIGENGAIFPTEPPDSGDGAARSRSVIRRENVQAGRPMNEGIEPPDSGDGAAHSCETCAEHDESLDEAYRKGLRDAGIDAAELVSLVEDAIGRFRQAGRDNTALWFENALARLRSGSPAPEGGE